jgi:hypothetical protein
VLAKPLLTLIVSADNIQDQIEPLSAKLSDDHFFSGSGDSHEEHAPLRSKTLANDQHYSKSFQTVIKDSLLPVPK